MDKIYDGGPAFPQHVAPQYAANPGLWGMSLRDWFAGQAMTAYEGSKLFDTPNDTLASWSYALADAMLAARKPRTEA